MRRVTAKPPEILIAVIPTVTAAIHMITLSVELSCSNAPITMMLDMAFVTLISGVCSAGAGAGSALGGAAESFGAGLRGIGLNLLVRDVKAECSFLETVFGRSAHQPTEDFAIVRYGDQVFQLHSDGTYHSNPLLGLLPEQPPRGAGIEIAARSTRSIVRDVLRRFDGRTVTVLAPEAPWEGGDLPLEPSARGIVRGPVRQLRDPGPQGRGRPEAAAP